MKPKVQDHMLMKGFQRNSFLRIAFHYIYFHCIGWLETDSKQVYATIAWKIFCIYVQESGLHCTLIIFKKVLVWHIRCL